MLQTNAFKTMDVVVKTVTVFLFDNRDVLPFTLKLPCAIAAAKTEAELEEIAQLGLSKYFSMYMSFPVAFFKLEETVCIIK